MFSYSDNLKPDVSVTRAVLLTITLFVSATVHAQELPQFDDLGQFLRVDSCRYK